MIWVPIDSKVNDSMMRCQNVRWLCSKTEIKISITCKLIESWQQKPSSLNFPDWTPHITAVISITLYWEVQLYTIEVQIFMLGVI